VRPAPPVQRAPRDGAAAKPEPSGPAAPAASAQGAATPQIQLIPASAEGALDAAEEAVDLLLDSGRAPSDVLVITTGEQHPWATHELSFGEASYWGQHDARDDVFYADAADVGRAASRPVVVVAINGGSDTAAAAALPLALGRAGTLLIVCGDPQQINAVLGASV
jgi:thioredoxin reductase